MDTIESIRVWLAALPPWINGLASVLGIVTFVSALLLFLWRIPPLLIDKIAKVSVSTAKLLATVLAANLASYGKALDTGTLAALVVGKAAVFLSVHIFFVGLILAAGVSGLGDLTVAGSLVMVTVLTSPLSLNFAAACTAMADPDAYAKILLLRIVELLTSAGFDRQSCEKWLEEQGVLPRFAAQFNSNRILKKRSMFIKLLQSLLSVH